MTSPLSGMIPKARARAARSIVLLLCTALSVVLTPYALRAQYLFDSWNTENGLPQNSVQAIRQTRDGYLWMTTSDGLVRYDGVRFAVFNKGNTSGVESNRFTVLFEASDGTLWAGTENGSATRYRDGVFSTHTVADSPAINPVWAFREDQRLGLMLMLRNGVARWDGEGFVPHRLGDHERTAPNGITQFTRYNSRFAWTDAQGLHLFDAGQFRTYTTRDGLSGLNVVVVVEDQRGNLWVVTADNKLNRFRDDRFTVFDLQGVAGAEVRAVLEDREGNVWVGATDGRLRMMRNGVWTEFGAEHNLPSRPLLALHEDREGTIWVGSYADGLFRIRRRAITTLSAANGLRGENVYPVLEASDGAIWFGVWNDGVYRIKDDRMTRYSARDGLYGTLFTSLYEDREGLLVGTELLYQLAGDRFVPVGRPENFTRGAIYAIHRDRAGTLWAGADNGLYRIREDSFRVLTNTDGLPNNTVQVITETRDGRLLFGTLGGLCILHRDGKFQTFAERDGLASNHVRAIYEDADGVLWIGTYDGGISRFAEGRFTNFNVGNGLFSDGAFQILEDERGNFWISCNTGVYRTSRREMNEVAAGLRRDITSISYGRKDGMLTIECNGGKQPAGVRARDGRLWFPTQRGVAVVNPSLVETNPLPPPVVIEDALIDNETSARGERVVLTPGGENLEIRYTGLSFIAPEHIRFRYKLEGLDADWTDAGTRRAAYYRYLPPALTLSASSPRTATASGTRRARNYKLSSIHRSGARGGSPCLLLRVSRVSLTCCITGACRVCDGRTPHSACSHNN